MRRPCRARDGAVVGLEGERRVEGEELLAHRELVELRRHRGGGEVGEVAQRAAQRAHELRRGQRQLRRPLEPLRRRERRPVRGPQPHDVRARVAGVDGLGGVELQLLEAQRGRGALLEARRAEHAQQHVAARQQHAAAHLAVAREQRPAHGDLERERVDRDEVGRRRLLEQVDERLVDAAVALGREQREAEAGGEVGHAQRGAARERAVVGHGELHERAHLGREAHGHKEQLGARHDEQRVDVALGGEDGVEAGAQRGGRAAARHGGKVDRLHLRRRAVLAPRGGVCEAAQRVGGEGRHDARRRAERQVGALCRQVDARRGARARGAAADEVLLGTRADAAALVARAIDGDARQQAGRAAVGAEEQLAVRDGGEAAAHLPAGQREQPDLVELGQGCEGEAARRGGEDDGHHAGQRGHRIGVVVALAEAELGRGHVVPLGAPRRAELEAHEVGGPREGGEHGGGGGGGRARQLERAGRQVADAGEVDGRDPLEGGQVHLDEHRALAHARAEVGVGAVAQRHVEVVLALVELDAPRGPRLAPVVQLDARDDAGRGVGAEEAEGALLVEHAGDDARLARQLDRGDALHGARLELRRARARAARDAHLDDARRLGEGCRVEEAARVVEEQHAHALLAHGGRQRHLAHGGHVGEVDGEERGGRGPRRDVGDAARRVDGDAREVCAARLHPLG
eukprot:scaffold106854_cov72-Phaeocystis_antarctica.AAC.2